MRSSEKQCVCIDHAILPPVVKFSEIEDAQGFDFRYRDVSRVGSVCDILSDTIYSDSPEITYPSMH